MYNKSTMVINIYLSSSYFFMIVGGAIIFFFNKNFFLPSSETYIVFIKLADRIKPKKKT